MRRYPLLIVAIAAFAMTGCAIVSHLPELPAYLINGPGEGHNLAATGFNVEVLGSTDGQLGSAGAESLSVSVDTATHVVVDVNVQDASALTGVLLKLTYDPALYRPMVAEPGAALGEREDILSLMVPVRPGEVQYAAVLTHPQLRSGFSGNGVIAQVSFRKAPDLTHRAVSTPFTTAACRVQNMTFAGTSRLGFSYSLAGDYDQNGEVNLADLMQIAVHYKEVSPAGAGNPFPFATAQSQVDGDSNGEIGLGDLTAISRNFRADALGGFRIFASTDQNDCPTDPAGANGLGAVELTAAPILNSEANNFQLKADERLSFQVPLAQPIADNYYWVRPYDAAGNPGIPSLYDPSGVAIPLQLAEDALPDSGSGSPADPFVLQDTRQYGFALIDTVSGSDLSQDPGTQFVVDAAAGTFNGNTLSITPGHEGDFSVTATYNGLPVEGSGEDGGGGTLYCYSRAMPRTPVIDKDPADPDWVGVTGTGADQAGAYILHTAAFNPDDDADSIYELVFSLQATRGSGGLVIPSADLDWDCFPPFCVADPAAFTADATAGTFQAWTFTSGYVFAQDPLLPVTDGKSNDLYVAVQNLP